MPPKKKQRFNAFDDFPIEETSESKLGFDNPLPAGVSTQQKPPVERIERLKPSQMVPDRFQPRRLLPSTIRSAFFNGKIDCYEAAARWLNLSRQDISYRAEIERLMAMGSSFDEHGQIKPITGSWVPASNGQFVFLIETGERRYWAACLQYVSQKQSVEPLLRTEAVNKPTRQRQVLENRHAETPSAVGQACEVASLILSEIGIQPDSSLQDEFDYFRKARSQRMPAGLWEKMKPIMQLTRPRMVQLLNILQLPTPLLELADRYRLPERVLREVLALPRAQWEKMLQISIQKSLTSDEVAELGGNKKGENPKKTQPASPRPQQPTHTAVGGLRRFANAIEDMDQLQRSQSLDEIADELFISGQAQELVPLLEELHTLLTARLRRRS